MCIFLLLHICAIIFVKAKKAWDNIVLFCNHSETLFVTKGSSGKRDSGLVFDPCRGEEWPD